MGSLDSYRDLQSICAKRFINRFHLVLYACVQTSRCDVFGGKNFESKYTLITRQRCILCRRFLFCFFALVCKWTTQSVIYFNSASSSHWLLKQLVGPCFNAVHLSPLEFSATHLFYRIQWCFSATFDSPTVQTEIWTQETDTCGAKTTGNFRSMRNSIAAGRNYTDIQLNQIMHVHVDTQLDSLPPKGQAAQAALTNKNM